MTVGTRSSRPLGSMFQVLVLRAGGPKRPRYRSTAFARKCRVFRETLSQWTSRLYKRKSTKEFVMATRHSLIQWLGNLFPGRVTRERRRPQGWGVRRTLPRVEELESRAVPATTTEIGTLVGRA